MTGLILITMLGCPSPWGTSNTTEVEGTSAPKAAVPVTDTGDRNARAPAARHEPAEEAEGAMDEVPMEEEPAEEPEGDEAEWD